MAVMGVTAESGRVAVYWDFENLHRSAMRNRRELLDLGAILRFGATFGTISVNRAYANWLQFSQYRSALQEQSIELVQLFPISGTKNGADIRLAVDAVADSLQLGNITTAVVITGDGDFIGLAQRLRTLGVRIIGIGARGSVNKRWIATCDEFKFYDVLVASTSGKKSPTARVATKKEVRDASTLFGECLRSLLDESDQPSVRQGDVRSLMKRLDPSFDHAAFGCRSFSDFVERHGGDDVKADRPETGDRLLSLRSGRSPVALVAPAPDPALAELRRQLSASSAHFPSDELLDGLVAWMPGVQNTFAVESEVDESLGSWFEANGVEATAKDLKRGRALLVSLRLVVRDEKSVTLVDVIDEMEARLRLGTAAADLLVRSVPGRIEAPTLCRLVDPNEPDPTPQLLERFEDLELGSVAHRLDVALHRGGISVIGSDRLARVVEWLGDDAREQTFADPHVFEDSIRDLGFEEPIPSRIRALLQRMGLVTAATAEPDDTGLSLQLRSPGEFYGPLAAKIATAPELASSDPDAVAESLLKVLGLEAGSEEAHRIRLSLSSPTVEASIPDENGVPDRGGVDSTAYDWRGRVLEGEAAVLARLLNRQKIVISDPAFTRRLWRRATTFEGGTADDLLEWILDQMEADGRERDGTAARRFRSLFHKARALERDGEEMTILADADEAERRLVASVIFRIRQRSEIAVDETVVADVVLGSASADDLELVRRAAASPDAHPPPVDPAAS